MYAHNARVIKFILYNKFFSNSKLNQYIIIYYIERK